MGPGNVHVRSKSTAPSAWLEGSFDQNSNIFDGSSLSSRRSISHRSWSMSARHAIRVTSQLPRPLAGLVTGAEPM